MTEQDEERSLDELALLTDTAGSEPIDRELVKRERIDPATYIGSGKAEELASLTTALDIDVVVGLPELWEHVRLSWTFGYFNPGAAFDSQEDAFLNKITLRIEL